jgi:hypothetical protein
MSCSNLYIRRVVRNILRCTQSDKKLWHLGIYIFCECLISLPICSFLVSFALWFQIFLVYQHILVLILLLRSVVSWRPPRLISTWSDWKSWFLPMNWFGWEETCEETRSPLYIPNEITFWGFCIKLVYEKKLARKPGFLYLFLTR